jgi:hypothetical protein
MVSARERLEVKEDAAIILAAAKWYTRTYVPAESKGGHINMLLKMLASLEPIVEKTDGKRYTDEQLELVVDKATNTAFAARLDTMERPTASSPSPTNPWSLISRQNTFACQVYRSCNTSASHALSQERWNRIRTLPTLSTKTSDAGSQQAGSTYMPQWIAVGASSRAAGVAASSQRSLWRGSLGRHIQCCASGWRGDVKSSR